MLRFVDTATQSLDPYVEIVPAEQLERVRNLTRELRGARILQLNATSSGGGVAELLNSLVPLEKGLGLDVEWGMIVAEPSFFALTKRLHNGLQGAPQFEVTQDEIDAYMRHNAHVAEAIRGKYDVVIVHDPQPAPVPLLARDTAASGSGRCTSTCLPITPTRGRFLKRALTGTTRSSSRCRSSCLNRSTDHASTDSRPLSTH